MTDSVSKAEGIKQLRDGSIGGDSPEMVKSGDWPIRLRGYYRALKRKEGWAIRLSERAGIQFWLTWIYGRPSMTRKLLFQENPFLKLIQKTETFSGSTLIVPVVCKAIK